MKTKGNLILAGIMIFLVSVLFQTFTTAFSSSENKQAWGNNIISRNVLGIKTVYSEEIFGRTQHLGTKIQSAPWMQKIGAKKIVGWSWSSEFQEKFGNSSNTEILLVIILRLLVKLLIPGTLIVLGLLLKKK